ncbi:hypothetical protein F0562_001468 [Nyssa sinensis]|uniref:RNase III domain-containing protein n=1 Tax=Nyssa sinensis TaxID=561372 RepID=A0A5J5C4M3_9ASTE|nr:hypothetical protein F0562_001468 [Nyssa sinensis]
MLVDHCTQNVVIPTIKVLEAITTKKCQESFHLESLETLGDSFLKYAASQQLFKTYQNNHEGLLSVKKEKIISNATLRKIGCDHKLPGFIRNEPFDPKMWIIPGDQSGNYALDEELLFCMRKVYNRGRRKVKSKTVADVVEALIGAFLSTGGEVAALSFMDWLGCYQRLEFLGDAVLDYLITMHLNRKHPGMSPGLLTDLSANFEQLSLVSTFGWESETNFPKVLGDVIESLAGAILIDSGYNKETVFDSIRPLLEPMITPDTLRLQPVRELNELCQKRHYNKKKAVVSRDNGVPSITVEVEANGVIYKHSCSAVDEKTAKKLASKAVLKSIKDSVPDT